MFITIISITYIYLLGMRKIKFQAKLENRECGKLSNALYFIKIKLIL